MSANKQDRKLDMAARAAWLYYVANNTQDEIAARLDVSRQAAQRLVALAVSEKLITFRLDHPLADCMALGEAVRAAHALEFCDVVPTDPHDPTATAGIALAAAQRIERLLAPRAPTVVALGTGRTLLAAIEQVAPMERPQHKVVSLIGNMASDGRASHYDVVMRLGERIGGESYPMPTPVIAKTAEERALLQDQRAFATLRDLVGRSKARLVGIGEIGWNAPLQKDGFIGEAETAELIERGAVGEITGWAFDAAGHFIADSVNDRVAGIAPDRPARGSVIAVACGPAKVAAIRAALTGRLVTGLVTDEATARALNGGDGQTAA